MARMLVDSGGMAARRVRRWPGRRATLLGLAVLLAFPAALGARTFIHHLRHPVSAASHKMDARQLKALVAPAPVPQAVLPVASVAPTIPPPAGPPATALLSVPYTVQAPFGNWKVHEESCEEAALLMYHDYLDGDARAEIPPGEADQQLRTLKAWQVQNWGAERDLSVARIGELAAAFYHHRPTVQEATRDTIESAIAAGHPVVVPVMTHALQNPNYGPHSVYHVVVIKGYTDRGVVANDGGVKEGRDWFYSWPILFAAIDAQTPVMHQDRVMLTLES